MTIRLAFFVDSPSRRAHGNAVSRLALGLAESGLAETTIACYSDDPAPAWLPDRVRLHRLGTDRATRALPALARYLGAEQPDVLITRQVHANFVGLAAAGMARARSRWPGRLVLVQDHLIELCHAANWRDNKWVAKAGYRFADGFLAPSPTVRDDVVRYCGLNPARAAVIPNPIPAFAGSAGPAPHPWLEDGQPPAFVNISNMMPFKRLDLTIEAFADLRRQGHDARLLLLGDGQYRERAGEQIRELGLSDSAETVGWIDDPLQYTARAWALVHSSDEDGFAQVLTEAMSTGCPAISTDARGGGPRFITGDGRCGILVPRGSRSGLAEAMARILSPEERSRYAKLGKQRSDELSPGASAHALLDFLATALDVGR